MLESRSRPWRAAVRSRGRGRGRRAPGRPVPASPPPTTSTCGGDCVSGSNAHPPSVRADAHLCGLDSPHRGAQQDDAGQADRPLARPPVARQRLRTPSTERAGTALVSAPVISLAVTCSHTHTTVCAVTSSPGASPARDPEAAAARGAAPAPHHRARTCPDRPRPAGGDPPEGGRGGHASGPVPVCTRLATRASARSRTGSSAPACCRIGLDGRVERDRGHELSGPLEYSRSPAGSVDVSAGSVPSRVGS